MAWFHDYSRDYDRAAGYNRGRNPRDTPGMRSSNRGYDDAWGSGGRWGSSLAGGSEWGTAGSRYDRGYGQSGDRGGYWGESSTRPSYNRDYMGRQYGYDSDYDYQFRQRNPESSPFYGRGADQEVQRWANRYGYDMQYEINPRGGGSGGGSGGGYGGAQRNMGSTQRGYGGSQRSTYRATGNQNRGGYGRDF